jgi:two-component system sensor histidine kinase VicK
LHNAEVINTLLQVLSNAQYRIDICGNSKFPSKILSFYSVNSLLLSSGKRTNTRQRYIFEITRENIDYCKKLIKKIELRHLDENEANFAVNERECLGFITMQKETLQATYSNMKEVVEQQQSVFETLWNKAIPARDKIMEIEEGLKSEFLEVISDHKKATEIYINLAKSVEREALILFANSKAIVRAKRLGILDYLITASKRGAVIKIITPITEENLQFTEQFCEKAPNIRILNGGASHSGLFIVDGTKFLRFELKEPKAEEFSDAIGFVLYSNSKVGAYSTRSFFELLWNEHIQYEKLKEADNMKNEFINVAAHELRTPIQPILGLTQILQSKIKDTKQSELLDAIVRNARRLGRLTNDILDVTKIESQSLNLKKEQFNLNDVISNTIEDIVANIDFIKNIQQKNMIKLLYQPYDIFVEADKARITQVISNLLNNAIKFTEVKEKDGRAGTISISVKNIDAEALVSVTDTGIGIDPEIMPRLFSKFTSKSYQGTGLGLFISKSIIEAHGGRIWAENNKIIKDGRGQVEKGATFTFSLPLNEKQREIKQEPQTIDLKERINRR